jgi:hypothetical protein
MAQALDIAIISDNNMNENLRNMFSPLNLFINHEF